MSRNYKEYDVYNLAEDLIVEVYQITKTFPSDERFGLTAHLRKTALSIPSNIAEGSARNSEREFFNFLNIAVSSTSELECQLRISFRLEYLPESKLNEFEQKTDRIRKMLSSLMKSLKSGNDLKVLAGR
jgi:four helix bundle protein